MNQRKFKNGDEVRLFTGGEYLEVDRYFMEENKHGLWIEKVSCKLPQDNRLKDNPIIYVAYLENELELVEKK